MVGRVCCGVLPIQPEKSGAQVPSPLPSLVNLSTQVLSLAPLPSSHHPSDRAMRQTVLSWKYSPVPKTTVQGGTAPHGKC